MSWLFEKKSYQSEKNGLILCERILGRWEVTVDGFYQSAPYTRQMWQTGLNQVPKSNKSMSVLVLGLGAGSLLDDIKTRFTQTSITAVEYDPIMIQLARELNFFDLTLPVNIILGDATQVVPALKGSFDLIIVDLYKGGTTAEVLSRPDFISSIESKLAANGTLILNVFRNTELFSLFDQQFDPQGAWKFSFNALALYKKKSTEG